MMGKDFFEIFEAGRRATTWWRPPKVDDDAKSDSMYVFPSKSICSGLNSLLATALERRGSGLSKTGF